MTTTPLELAMGRFAAGDDAAFAEVYDQAAPAVYRFLVKLARDQALAEDLTHETFLRVHGARASYRADARVLPWMFAIARRLFLDNVRANRRGARLFTSRDDDERTEADVPAETAGPEDLLLEAKLRAEVDRILSDMPEPHATAYRLLREENLSVSEAAAVVGTTETGLKLRAHRAYTTLRTVLGARWLDAEDPRADVEQLKTRTSQGKRGRP